MPSFKTELDIANRACQHIGVPRIIDFTSTKAGKEIAACYDNVRESELQRNLWTCSTRRAILRAINYSTMLWTPPVYSSTTTYSQGAVVTDANGDWWECNYTKGLFNNAPQVGPFWSRYYGPETLTSFVDNTNKPPGAVTLGSTSSGSLFAATYYVQTTYNTSQGETLPSQEQSFFVADNFVLTVTSPAAETNAFSWNCYISTVSGQEQLQFFGINIGSSFQLPDSGLISVGVGVPLSGVPGGFAGQSFAAGELSSKNNVVYRSLINNNTSVPNTSTWLEVDGTAVPLQIIYPIGSGPSIDNSTANAYRRPHGFLRQAPSNPKGSAMTWLGAPWGNVREDWVFEGDYILSYSPGPIMFRFVSDFVDVPKMTSMLCEGIAARIATEVCEPLTQSTEKLSVASAAYKRAMFEARTVNAIEAGPVDMDIDDYITCRY